MKQAIRPTNEEEIKEGIDIEMEDAQTEEEKELIRADRALDTKINKKKTTKQINQKQSGHRFVQQSKKWKITT